MKTLTLSLLLFTVTFSQTTRLACIGHDRSIWRGVSQLNGIWDWELIQGNASAVDFGSDGTLYCSNGSRIYRMENCRWQPIEIPHTPVLDFSISGDYMYYTQGYMIYQKYKQNKWIQLSCRTFTNERIKSLEAFEDDRLEILCGNGQTFSIYTKTGQDFPGPNLPLGIDLETGSITSDYKQVVLSLDNTLGKVCISWGNQIDTVQIPGLDGQITMLGNDGIHKYTAMLVNFEPYIYVNRTDQPYLWDCWGTGIPEFSRIAMHHSDKTIDKCGNDSFDGIEVEFITDLDSINSEY